MADVILMDNFSKLSSAPGATLLQSWLYSRYNVIGVPQVRTQVVNTKTCLYGATGSSTPGRSILANVAAATLEINNV